MDRNRQYLLHSKWAGKSKRCRQGFPQGTEVVWSKAQGAWCLQCAPQEALRLRGQQREVPQTQAQEPVRVALPSGGFIMLDEFDYADEQAVRSDDDAANEAIQWQGLRGRML